MKAEDVPVCRHFQPGRILKGEGVGFSPPSGTYKDTRYVFSCVDCVGHQVELLREMVETANEIKHMTFVEKCGTQEWALAMGYETDKRKGLTLRNDLHVRYYRSKWAGAKCYFLVHSAIEHVWLSDWDLRKAGVEFD